MTNQKPVEYFSASRINIEIEGRAVIWRDMTIEINSRIGEHTVGEIKYIASGTQYSMYDALMSRKGDKRVTVSGISNVTDESGEPESKIFINGIIEKIKLRENRPGAMTVKIKCVSISVLLDRIPRYRSFQDTALTYKNISEEVNKNYEEKLVSAGEDMKGVPRMTVQYNETDWQYLKRIASYVGEPVIAYSDKVLVGFFKNRPIQIPNISYSHYGREIDNGREYYTILGTEVYTVSMPVKLKLQNKLTGEVTENDYYVTESRIYNVGNELKCEYILGKQTDYFVDPIPNEKIRGAVIEGRVIHVARTGESQSNHGMEDGSADNLEGRTMGIRPLNLYIEKSEGKEEDKSEKVRARDIAVMTLDLTEGLRKLGGSVQSEGDKYAGKSYFPYVTPYSQTNTGFSPAPEVNDRVALYFPSENETHGIVIGAVSNEGNGRFSNPENRNYHVGESDFNMVLAKDSLSTSAASSISQSASSISESAETISNNAKNYTEIVEESKNIVANNILQITQENLNIQTNGDTKINSDGISVINGGSNVYINKG